MGLGLFSLIGLGLGLAGALNRPVAVAFPVVGYVWLGVDLTRRGVVAGWGGPPSGGGCGGPAGAAWVWGIPAVSLTMSAVAASICRGRCGSRATRTRTT